MSSIPLAATPPRPTWRGVLHSWAFVCSLPLGIALLLDAESALARAGATFFAASLSAMLGTSAAYHRLARGPRARLVLGRLDHSMIYLLIAGTYTPLCLLALPVAWAVPLLVVVWTGAIAGILVKATGAARLAPWANGLYVVLGWAGLVGLPVMVASLSGAGLALLLVGGIAYTVGVIVFFTGRPDPAPATFGYHEIWHACTLVGAGAHGAVVWMLIS